MFELTSGAKSKAERDKVERLLAPATVLSLDEGSSRLAAEVRRRLEKLGQPIGMADYLIAGICLSHAAVLLTRNTAHFERVPGLELGNLSA